VWPEGYQPNALRQASYPAGSTYQQVTPQSYPQNYQQNYQQGYSQSYTQTNPQTYPQVYPQGYSTGIPAANAVSYPLGRY
jgi:hypothetical protein